MGSNPETAGSSGKSGGLILKVPAEEKDLKLLLCKSLCRHKDLLFYYSG